MAILSETRKYRLTGITPMLGSNPANPEIHSAYVSIKAESLAKAQEETSMLPTEEELKNIKEQGLTVYLRNGRGQLCIGNHVIKGFLKAALATLKDQVGVAAAKSKIDNLVFIEPTYIPVMQDGEPITEADGYNERSLRAETMQGPRVSLASSEEIEAPWTVDFEMTLLNNNGSAKSKALTWEILETVLDYGRFKGLGQWRNSGKGSFTWERLA